MARRISLPSADELFAEPPASGVPGDVLTPVPLETALSTAPARRSRGRAAMTAVPTDPGDASPGARRRAAGEGTVARLGAVAGSLRELPIDVLLDLRDGLEGMLGSRSLRAADVEALLGRLGV